MRTFAMKFFSTALMLGFLHSPSFSAPALQISPEEFDFGWAPDNSKIDCDFVLKNSGANLLPITEVRPACGCTASDFKPASLESNEETKVRLTFDTRGYTNIAFNKTAKVETGTPDTYTVRLKGHVTNSNAQVAPTGDGIAAFTPEAKEKKKSLVIQNKTSEDVALIVVQSPSEWATVKLPDMIKAGEKAEADVSVSGDLGDARHTSITVEARSATVTQRFTLAIRTGMGPKPLGLPVALPEKKPVDKPKPGEKKVQ